MTDILPANVTRGIDEKGTVQGNFFEIVVGPVGPEGGEFGVGEEGEGESEGEGEGEGEEAPPSPAPVVSFALAVFGPNDSSGCHGLLQSLPW